MVTVQQASHKSPYYETYQPYLNKLVEFIKMCTPGVKIAIHQTWAYEKDSQKLNMMRYEEHTKMFEDVRESYQKAFEETNADIIIPSGEVLQKLIAHGVEKVHRDTFHLSYGLGRYAVGLLWYAILSGKDVKNNTFCDFDEEISEADVETAKECVAEICSI